MVKFDSLGKSARNSQNCEPTTEKPLGKSSSTNAKVSSQFNELGGGRSTISSPSTSFEGREVKPRGKSQQSKALNPLETGEIANWLDEERERAKAREDLRQTRKHESLAGQEVRANRILERLIEREKNGARRLNLKGKSDRSQLSQGVGLQNRKLRDDAAQPSKSPSQNERQSVPAPPMARVDQRLGERPQADWARMQDLFSADLTTAELLNRGERAEMGDQLALFDHLAQTLRAYPYRFELEQVLALESFAGRFVHLRKIATPKTGDSTTFQWGEFVSEVRWGLQFAQCASALANLSFELYANLNLLPFAASWFAQVGLVSEDSGEQYLMRQLLSICEKIAKIPISTSRQISIQLTKLGSKANYMDSIKDNIPFRAGTFIYSKSTDSSAQVEKTCAQLRHPTPTVETPGIPQVPMLSNLPIVSEIAKILAPRIEICPIYRAFVERTAERKERILYSNHQANSHDEVQRVAALAKFSGDNAECHTFITLPFRYQIEDQHCANTADFCQYLRDLAGDCDQLAPEKFYFPPSCREFAVQRSRVWADFLQNHLIQEGELVHLPRRCMYLTLFQSFLRGDLIRELEIDYCNDTCKDAIDRGALHLFADVLWAQMISGQDQNRRNRQQLSILTLYPALFARSRAILDDKLEVICELAQKLESLDERAKKTLASEWKRCADLNSLQFDFCQDTWQSKFTYKIDEHGADENALERATVRNWRQLERDLKRRHGIVIDRKDCAEFSIELVQNRLRDCFSPLRTSQRKLKASTFEWSISCIADLLSQSLIADCLKKARLFAKMRCPSLTDLDLVHGNPPAGQNYRPLSRLTRVEGRGFPQHFALEVEGRLWVERVADGEKHPLTTVRYRARALINSLTFFRKGVHNLQFDIQLSNREVL